MKKKSRKPSQAPKSNAKKAMAVGAGLAAVAAAAAGVYMLTGKNAKNRKKVAKWATDLEHDVVKELNKAGKASKATYTKIVDNAAKNYKNIKTISGPDLAIVANELKASWDVINSELQNASKVVKKVVPKTARSVAKRVGKVAKKAVKTVSKKSAKKATRKKTTKRRR